jgi:HSP20 family protein
MLATIPKRTASLTRPPRNADLFQYMDRVFDNLRREMLTGAYPLSTLPPFSEIEIGESRLPALADIEDRGTGYEVRANLPGVRKDNLNMLMHGHTLRIDAKERAEKEEKSKNYLCRERTYQGFERTIELPEDVVPDQITARYEDGVLTLTVPKAHPEPEKKIPVS